VRRVLLATSVFALIAAPASAAVRVRAEIPPVATTGDVVHVRGSVSRRARVVLQRRTAAGWRRVGSARVAARRFSLAWRAPARSGVVFLRVSAGRMASTEGRVAVVPVEVVSTRSVTSAPPVGSAGSLRLTGRRRLRSGDFVAVGAGRATPYGLLARVIDTHLSRRATVVDTEPASLFDVLPEGEVALHSVGVARAAAASPRAFLAPLSCSPGATGSVDGSLTTTLDPELRLSWSGGSVRAARATVTARGDVDLGVHVGGKVTCSLPEKPVATWVAPPLSAFVGPIPIVVVPRTTLYVSADASTASALDTRIRGPITATAGLEYDGATRAVGSFEQRLTATGPATRADASVGARLTPSVEFLLYGQAGPRFDLSTGLQLDATGSGDPWWRLSAPVELSAGLRVPGFELGQRTVFSRSFPLAQAAPGSAPSAPPAPSSPARERARMTWDTGADIDLHVWDASGRHTWFRESGIPGVLLSHDDTDGFGPETFEEDSPAGRTFTYGVCYFNGVGATHVSMLLTDPDGRQRAPAATLNAPGDSILIGSSPAGAAFTPPAGWCRRQAGG
jgi:hypothetical protein